MKRAVIFTYGKFNSNRYSGTNMLFKLQFIGYYAKGPVIFQYILCFDDTYICGPVKFSLYKKLSRNSVNKHIKEEFLAPKNYSLVTNHYYEDEEYITKIYDEIMLDPRDYSKDWLDKVIATFYGS